jgi:pyrroloquinoline quinone biosynthesis protein D
MTREVQRPLLVSHARYRWDALRRQHQLVFPEGILVLNEPGAAIVRLCDGRTGAELLAALGEQFPGADLAADVSAFLERLDRKGLLRDAADR